MWIEAAVLRNNNGKEEWKTVKMIQPTPFDYSKFAITPEMLERNARWKILESYNGVSYLLSNLSPPNIISNTTVRAKEIRMLYSQFLVIKVPVHDKYLSLKFKFEPITGVVVLPDEKSCGVVLQIVPHNETHDRILAEYWQTEMEGTVLKTECELTSLTTTSPVPSDAHQAETIIKEGYIVAHYWIDITREGSVEGLRLRITNARTSTTTGRASKMLARESLLNHNKIYNQYAGLYLDLDFDWGYSSKGYIPKIGPYTGVGYYFRAEVS